jgi:hypothetical protein
MWSHPIRIRFRRRYLAIPILLMVPVVIAVVWSSALVQPNSRAQRGASLPSPYCRTGDILAGIYNPPRFHIISNCQVASGVVKSLAIQRDGVWRIDIVPDSQYTKLLDPGNTNSQNGMLVLGLFPTDQATVSLPTVGEHVVCVGPLVYDIENSWNSISPAWSIKAE